MTMPARVTEPTGQSESQETSSQSGEGQPGARSERKVPAAARATDEAPVSSLPRPFPPEPLQPTPTTADDSAAGAKAIPAPLEDGRSAQPGAPQDKVAGQKAAPAPKAAEVPAKTAVAPPTAPAKAAGKAAPGPKKDEVATKKAAPEPKKSDPTAQKAAPEPKDKGDVTAKKAAGKVEAKGPVPAPAPEQGVPPTIEPEESSVARTRALVRSVRRERARRFATRLALFVILPTLLAAVYYVFIASDQFESTASFSIHSAENRVSVGLESLLGAVGSGGPAAHDTMAVREYVLSRDVLGRLDKEHQFITHYKSPQYDWFSRLAGDASFESAYEYYQKKVTAEFDSLSGTLTLRVRAFTPAAAQQFTRAILEYSEEKVNLLSQRERTDRIRYAADEVRLAEERVAKARRALLALQQQHGDLNPLHTAQAAMTIKTGLETELAKTRAELGALRAYMNPEAPEVIALREKAKALAGQIANEGRRLVDPKNQDGVAEVLAEYEAATIEKEFADKAYAAAHGALEMARADALRQHRYLVALAEPSRPDESTYPERATAIAGAFGLSILSMGILSLLLAAIREHASI